MTDHRLLPSQRNEIFASVQAAGLSPADFRWDDAPSVASPGLRVPRLTHLDSGFYYQFDLVNGEHWCAYSPGDTSIVREQYPGSWRHQLEYCQRWLQYLKREISVVDLWAAIESERALFANTQDVVASDDTPFTADERARIRDSVASIGEYIRSTNVLDESRLGFIENRLTYLVESSERLGRKDWINLAMGVVTNIVIGASLAPDAARDLLRVIGTGLGWLLGGNPLLPHPLQ